MSNKETFGPKASALSSDPDLVEMLVMNLDTERALDVLEELDPGTRARVDRMVERATNVISALAESTPVAEEGKSCAAVAITEINGDCNGRNVISAAVHTARGALSAKAAQGGGVDLACSPPEQFQLSNVLADTSHAIASYARKFLLGDFQPFLLGAPAAAASAQVFTYRLQRSDVVPSNLAEGALAWAIFPLYLVISPESDQEKTRIRVKLDDTVSGEDDISGGKCALQVDFEYQHEVLSSFRLSEKRYDIDTVVSIPIDRREDLLVKVSLASPV